MTNNLNNEPVSFSHSDADEEKKVPDVLSVVDEEVENKEFDLTPEIASIVQRTLDIHLDLLIKLKNN